MDRCRKCNKPLVLGPSTCSNCGEPLFGMDMSPAIHVPASTVNTHDSGVAPDLAGVTSSTGTTKQGTWTAPASTSEGSQHAWTPPSRAPRLPVVRLVRMAVTLVILAVVASNVFGFARAFDIADMLDGQSGPPTSTSPFSSSPPSIPAPAVQELPDAATLPAPTALPTSAFTDDDLLNSATVLRTGESTSVNFIATGGASKPTRTVFLSSSIDGSYPTVTAQNPPRVGVSGIESGQLPLEGTIALGPNARFAWRVVRSGGLRVVLVTITHGSRVVVLHGGDLSRSRATSSGLSPLSYDELGTVADYFLARLDG